MYIDELYLSQQVSSKGMLPEVIQSQGICIAHGNVYEINTIKAEYYGYVIYYSNVMLYLEVELLWGNNNTYRSAP